MSEARNYWYPVAMAADVVDGPFATRLLGEDIVVYRADGQLVALQDLCIHRGTPLSIGAVEGDTLVCAYHGWRYDTGGRCVEIPQRRGHPVPAKARVPKYLAEERYGVVWACLSEPKLPLPDFPEYDDPDYRVTFAGPHRWQAGAARMMENFLDTAHLAWVHHGKLGHRNRPDVDLTPIRHCDDGFDFYAENEVLIDGHWRREPLKFHLRLPYVFNLVRDSPRVVQDVPEGIEPRYVVFICIQPLSGAESVRYSWVARNYSLREEADAQFRGFTEALCEEDRFIVERQRPELLPLDLAAEMHIKKHDDAAVAFRRLLARTGIDESAMAPEHR